MIQSPMTKELLGLNLKNLKPRCAAALQLKPRFLRGLGWTVLCCVVLCCVVLLLF